MATRRKLFLIGKKKIVLGRVDGWRKEEKKEKKGRVRGRERAIWVSRQESGHAAMGTEPQGNTARNI